MNKQEAKDMINHFQAFLILDGQLDISPDKAIRNRDIFLSNYSASSGITEAALIFIKNKRNGTS